MTKQLTVSEILEAINEGWFLRSKTDYPKGFTGADVRKIQEKANQSLKTLVTEMVNEIIGEGEAHVSHVCPQYSIPCREFAARGQLRHEQRQRAKAEIERRFE